MSCLFFDVARVTDVDFLVYGSDPLTFDVAKKGEELICSISPLPQMEFQVARKGDKLSIDCSLVCKVARDFYLRVEPEIVWLTPDMGVDVQVWSNTNWYIE